ncbi:hypothetical protein QTI66_25305 [Variovorax sp. J22R133]|uniref:hypothetical protein n=1 Tax=Variovorax brevis TaxID=3053503 RepID=UPI002577CBE9|nr:hypothetical protein [Variovorax sp. J22R133]MDM0115491.1 hypothetical protein [Variovorax sp. J22R133]
MNRIALSRAIALLALWTGAASAQLAVGADTTACTEDEPCLMLRLADDSVVRVPSESVEKRSSPLDNAGHNGPMGDGSKRMAPRPRGRLFDLNSPGAIASVRG